MPRGRGLGECSVDGCAKFAWARRLCPTHYSRWLKHGDPLIVLPRSRPPINTRPKKDRWADKVNHNDHALDGCCEWIGATSSHGYGQLRTGQRGPIEMAHRLAWEFEVGPIPAGLNVLHHCDNPSCVRTQPDRRFPTGHLFLGTQGDNMRDMAAKGRAHRPTSDLRKHVPRGEGMGRAAKLRTADIVAIRARSDAGETQVAIARDYPVSRSQIGDIAARRAWRHVP